MVDAPSDPDALPIALVNQLKRIGNNLNQIAHAANAGLPPDHRKTAADLRDLINAIVQNELSEQTDTRPQNEGHCQ